MTKVAITTPEIRLDALMKFSGMCQTGGQAKILIQEGQVFVNGTACLQRTKKIHVGDVVSYATQTVEVTGS